MPGDVVLLAEGDTIPADARLAESTALQTAEAALTGESLPVTKDTAPIAGEAALGDRHNMVFSRTAATYGHGRAVVTATGMRTEMGHIAGLLAATREEKTPLSSKSASLPKSGLTPVPSPIALPAPGRGAPPSNPRLRNRWLFSPSPGRVEGDGRGAGG